MPTSKKPLKWKILRKVPLGMEMRSSSGPGTYAYCHIIYKVTKETPTGRIVTSTEYGEPLYLHEHPEALVLFQAALPLHRELLYLTERNDKGIKRAKR